MGVIPTVPILPGTAVNRLYVILKCRWVTVDNRPAPGVMGHADRLAIRICADDVLGHQVRGGRVLTNISAALTNAFGRAVNLGGLIRGRRSRTGVRPIRL
jgi:hypothetical protein